LRWTVVHLKVNLVAWQLESGGGREKVTDAEERWRWWACVGIGVAGHPCIFLAKSTNEQK
jgi:hypothetical protein